MTLPYSCWHSGHAPCLRAFSRELYQNVSRRLHSHVRTKRTPMVSDETVSDRTGALREPGRSHASSAVRGTFGAVQLNTADNPQSRCTWRTRLILSDSALRSGLESTRLDAAWISRRQCIGKVPSISWWLCRPLQLRATETSSGLGIIELRHAESRAYQPTFLPFTLSLSQRGYMCWEKHRAIVFRDSRVFPSSLC